MKTFRIAVSALVLALGIAAPLVPVQARSVAADDPDPAKLAEAHKMLDVLMPPPAREAMITSLVNSIMDTMMKGITESPDFRAMTAKTPGADAVFDRFIAGEREYAKDKLVAETPAMFDAMARAYARRFTIDQMQQVAVFFASPAGRAYMDAAPSIFADPDVAAWQQGLMRDSMARMPAAMADLKRELDALKEKGKPHGR
jgi:hypothetical protein